MSTTTTPVPADVAWACALALGLGYAAKPDQACVQELLAGARGSATTLRQARESLDEMAVTDPTAHQRTGRLLDLASRLALDQTPRPGPGTCTEVH
jgi:hypothetical protein